MSGNLVKAVISVILFGALVLLFSDFKTPTSVDGYKRLKEDIFSKNYTRIEGNAKESSIRNHR